MQSVRYFGVPVDPGQYRRGFGFAGWWICVLNGIRAWLEQRIVLAILDLQAKHAGLSRAERKELRRQALQDPLLVPEQFQAQVRNARTTSIADKIPLLRRQIDQDERTAKKYARGRKVNIFDDPKPPMRPQRFEESQMRVTFARAATRNDRSLRYFGGHQFNLIESEDQSLIKAEKDE